LAGGGRKLGKFGPNADGRQRHNGELTNKSPKVIVKNLKNGYFI